MGLERVQWFLSLLITLKSEPIFELCCQFWELSACYLCINLGWKLSFYLEFISPRVLSISVHKCPFEHGLS